MNKLIALLLALLMLGSVAALAEEDPMLDKIYALDSRDYSGMLTMTEQVDGAYATALESLIVSSFFMDPAAFLAGIAPGKPEQVESAIFFLVSGCHQRNFDATHPFLILEDELSLIPEPSEAVTAMTQRVREAIVEFEKNNLSAMG